MESNNKKSPKKTILIVVALIVVGAIIKIVFFKNKFTYTGTIEATKVDISAQVSYTLSHVLVQEGDRVINDQALIELDCQDLKVESTLANVTYDRQLKLLRAGANSQESFDQAKNKKDNSYI